MLGCHEFCGYYDWTFHYIRRRFGAEGVARLWAEAIGGESQDHYRQAGLADGLAGLYHTWVKTGEEENCDWTFTLDEAANVLRFDMRRCPSKGFLLQRGLHADEDYCDHCMGWTIPLLADVGAEICQHEHNHQGQCWAEIRMKDRPTQPLDLAGDIRRTQEWQTGHLDRWQQGEKQPLLPAFGRWTDPVDVLLGWFASSPVVWAVDGNQEAKAGAGVSSSGVYLAGGDQGFWPLAVLVPHGEAKLAELATRWKKTPAERRPLLVHPYLPGRPVLNFLAHGLPRPMPILPLLIRTGQYTHTPGGEEPAPDVLLRVIVAALGKLRR